jgi:3D (Asp-Asp-Asp) domain-containing protein/tellurite resistance protein
MKRAKKNKIRRIKKAILFSTVMMCFSVAVYSSQIKRVSVDYLGDIVTFKTMAKTVAQAFQEKNIIISEDLVVSMELNTELAKENTISIDAPKILAMLEEEKTVETVAEVDKQIDETSETSKKEDPKEEESKKEEPKKEEPKKEEPKKEEPKKEKKKPTTTTRTYWPENVVEIEPGVIQTPDGRKLEYSSVMQMEATAYCACYSCCGKYPSNKYYGITKTGTRAKVGTIAVDPRKIPLGTELYIEGLYGAKNYGDGKAEDIGGAIKGNIIDLYFDTHKETINWGRQQVMVYILK